MTADTNAPTEAVAEAAKEQTDAAAETAKAAAEQRERVASKTAKATKRTAKTVRKAATKSRLKARPAAAKPQPRANERNDQMKYDPTNMFTGLTAFPGAAAFEKLFTDAAQRGEEAAKRSRKAAEEFAEIYRGNVDAFVEAGRIATAGAQSIGQDFVAKSRDSVEQTADTVRSLAEAKTATELLQLQSDLARSTFDRFVEDSSSFAEAVVKLAGEAFQPISNRASANLERLNDIAA